MSSPRENSYTPPALNIDERLPSLQVVSLPTRRDSITSDPGGGGRARVVPRTRGGPVRGGKKETYEHLFMRKKTYEKEGASALRKVPSPNILLDTPVQFFPQFTKVITETISELEEEECSHQQTQKKRENSNVDNEATATKSNNNNYVRKEEPEEVVEQKPSSTIIFPTNQYPPRIIPSRSRTPSPSINPTPLPPARGMTTATKEPSKFIPMRRFTKKKTFIPVPAVPTIEELSSSTCSNSTSAHSTKTVKSRSPAHSSTGSRKQSKSKSFTKAGTVSSNESSSINGSNQGTHASKIPRLIILPGHGKGRMELPLVTKRAGEPGSSVENNSIGESTEKTAQVTNLGSSQVPEKVDYTQLNFPHITCVGSGSSKGSRVKKEVCRKCKHYKDVLNQSEETIRHLTELLEFKDNETELLRAEEKSASMIRNSTKSVKTKNCATNTSNPCIYSAVDLLLVKSAKSLKSLQRIRSPVEMKDTSESIAVFVNSFTQTTKEDPLPPQTRVAEEEKPNSTSSQDTPTTSPCAIPKFDLDEFIRKVFRHVLLSQDYTNKNNVVEKGEHEQQVPEPSELEYIHLFRTSLAARECIMQTVKQKLKYGYHILKGRYDNLMSYRTLSANELSCPPLNESHFLEVLDSYRRFVRFIYFYLKQSMSDIDSFEVAYIPLLKPSCNNKIGDGDMPKLKYSHETSMVMDGVKYTGVFIPIQAEADFDYGKK